MTITTAFCISIALGLIACIGWFDCARALKRQCRMNKELLDALIRLQYDGLGIAGLDIGGSDG